MAEKEQATAVSPETRAVAERILTEVDCEACLAGDAASTREDGAATGAKA